MHDKALALPTLPSAYPNCAPRPPLALLPLVIAKRFNPLRGRVQVRGFNHSCMENRRQCPSPYHHHTLTASRGRHWPFYLLSLPNGLHRYEAAFGASPFSLLPMMNQLPPPYPHHVLTAPRGRDLPRAFKTVKTAHPVTRPRLGRQPVILHR